MVADERVTVAAADVAQPHDPAVGEDDQPLQRRRRPAPGHRDAERDRLRARSAGPGGHVGAEAQDRAAPGGLGGGEPGADPAEDGHRGHAVPVVGDEQQPGQLAGTARRPGVGPRLPRPPRALDLGDPPRQRVGQRRPRQRRPGERLDPHLVGRDQAADRLGHRVRPVGGDQAGRHVERPHHVVDQDMGIDVVQVEQRRPAPGRGLRQLVAALVGYVNDEAVDHGRVAAGVDVEVDDVGAAGREVGGDRGEVARLVRQLDPQLMTRHGAQSAVRGLRPAQQGTTTTRTLPDENLTRGENAGFRRRGRRPRSAPPGRGRATRTPGAPWRAGSRAGRRSRA